MSNEPSTDTPSASEPPPAGAADGTREHAQERTAGLPQLVLLLAASCMPVLGSVLIAPVLPQMSEHFAGTPRAAVLVPVVLTVPALVLGLTAPFAGLVVDRIDRKRLLLFAMVAYTVVGTAPLYLDALGAILASRVLLGLTEAAIMTCCTTLIGDYWSGTRRARYLGMQVLVTAFVATAFLLVGGALGVLGWRTPFWVYLVAVLLVVPMARLLWQPSRPEADRTARRLEPLPWSLLLVPCLITVFGGALFYALPVQLPFVLTAWGITSAAMIGLISAIMSLATAIGAALFGRLSRFPVRTLVPIELGVAALGLGVVFVAPSVPVVTVGAVFTGFGTGLLLPTLLLWATHRLDFEQRGRGTGLWTGTMFLGQFTSPLLIAAIGVGAGGLQPALGVFGAVTLALALLMIPALRNHTRGLTSG